MAKYTDAEKQENLTAYLNAKGGTYHSYMSLLGESLANRIDLLSQLLNEAHYPTTGRYKESLLSELIAKFVPGRYSVGTGFVLFPVESYNVEGHGDEAEAILSIDKHVPSRQMDIIIYDSHSYPTIYRDGDVVVVRPEAVRCLIEVKGHLSHVESDDIVDKFVDFASKWRDCVKCYAASGIELKHKPTLLAMCWAVRPDPDGRPLTDGLRLRERIVTKYKEANFHTSFDRTLPLLSAVGIYRQHIVATARRLAENGQMDIGYETLPGLCRVEGRNLDRTVTFLLERVQLSLESPLATKAFSAPTPEAWESELVKLEDEKLGFKELVRIPLVTARA